MKKANQTIFVCSNCGNEFSKWQGQCSACGEWNSLKEISNVQFLMSKKNRTGERKEVRKVAEIETKNEGFTNIIPRKIKEELYYKDKKIYVFRYKRKDFKNGKCRSY